MTVAARSSSCRARRRPGASGHRRSRARSRSRPVVSGSSSAGRVASDRRSRDARPAEARVAADVHVQQIARARPLVAVRGAALADAGGARCLGARAPSRPSNATGRSRRQPTADPNRSPGEPRRSAPRVRRRGQPRLAMRPAGTVLQPRPATRVAAGEASASDATTYAPCRPKRRSRLPPLAATSPLDQQHQRPPPSRSELRVSVNAHPGPPDCSSWRNRRDSGRARTSSVSRSQRP